MASYKDSDPSGIYKFVNTINGKVYVGCSNHLLYRYRQHVIALRSQTHVNCYLQAAFNLYGEDAFEWNIIEICPVDQLHTREKHWIRYYSSFGNGYNLTEGGEGTFGRRWTTAQRELFQKPVVCLNTMQQYASVREAVRLGGGGGDSPIIKVCTGRAVYSGIRNGERLVWRYATDITGISESELQKIVSKAQHFRPRKTCCHIVSFPDERIFESESDAAKYYGIKVAGVNGILKGRNLTATAKDGSHVTFRLLADYVAMNDKDKESLCALATIGFRGKQGALKKRKVVMFPGQHVFDSLTVAEQETGANNSSISTSCSSPLEKKKRTKLLDGTWAIWCYYEDYLSLSADDREWLNTQVASRRTQRITSQRKVRLINTGEVFNSIKAAAAKYEVSTTTVGTACRGGAAYGGKSKDGDKLFWEYVA